MKLIEWMDEDGYKRGSLLREGDPEPIREAGLPVSPPDVNLIDWDAVKRDLHNQLYERGIFNWDDVQRAQSGVTGAVLAALKRQVLVLYRGGG